jgi:hypothetical protein
VTGVKKPAIADGTTAGHLALNHQHCTSGGIHTRPRHAAQPFNIMEDQK